MRIHPTLRVVPISMDSIQLCESTPRLIQARASSFVNDIKQSPDVWGLCVERFSVTAYSEVKFWCLQTLHEVRYIWKLCMLECRLCQQGTLRALTTET
jgi:hypothetical protein